MGEGAHSRCEDDRLERAAGLEVAVAAIRGETQSETVTPLPSGGAVTRASHVPTGITEKLAPSSSLGTLIKKRRSPIPARIVGRVICPARLRDISGQKAVVVR